MTVATLSVFIPTFFFVSLTPGMCMTLALSLGMTVGFRRTLWMMSGELVGVGLVATLSVIGVATIMLSSPWLFTLLKYGGGLYLGFLGVQLWLSRGNMALDPDTMIVRRTSRVQLIAQGFITAVANPKGWAFFIALLPPFIDQQLALAPQLSILLSMILLLEFLCLMLYAGGGRSLNRFLHHPKNVRLLNRIAGVLMLGVGVWLAFG